MKKEFVLFYLLITVLFLGVLYSCSENPAATGEASSEPVWEAWRNPKIFNYYFSAIWGSPDGNVYVFGRQGMILRLDGVWGDGPGRMFAVGRSGTILKKTEKYLIY